MKVNIGKFPTDANKERTVNVQIDPYDTWNLDYTLALIIHPALVKFKNTEHGYPGCFKSLEEWDDILDKMIWSFEQIVLDDIGYDPVREEKLQEGLDLFGKWYQALWN